MRVVLLRLNVPKLPPGGPSANDLTPMESTPAVMAAVDLGSNSFHMVVARLRHGQFAIIDRIREMVRLASGIDAGGGLSEQAAGRALDCLGRFGERLRDMHARQVRVVGTNTLRRARRARGFLRAAKRALGHPVEVISGIEEARLIYLGVSHHVPSADEQMLVIDIGGGSTELIIGEGYEPKYLESLFMGCVGLSEQFFDGGQISTERVARARLAARLELQPVIATFQSLGWKTAVGSSGTIRAAERVARSMGLIEDGLTINAMEAVMNELIRAGGIENLGIADFNPQRAPVFPGGLVILLEAMAGLEIDELQISDGALREGLLYDMLGRIQRHDARDRTIGALQLRFNVDRAQAERVEASALKLLAQVDTDWGLEGEFYARSLIWAARLHELGLDIAHAKHHRHAAYLIANADLPGFNRLEQFLLAILVGHHRRKMDDYSAGELPSSLGKPALRLTVLFRLAVLFNRSRRTLELPPIHLQVSGKRVQVMFERSWVRENHLTRADLEQERVWLRAVGFKLRVGDQEDSESSRSRTVCAETAASVSCG